MDFGLKDKIVVITGGAGRIGSEFSRSVAKAGAVAVIADSSAEQGQARAAEINAEPGCRAEFQLLDITSKDSAQTVIAAVHEKYGRIDGLVNNAYPRNPGYGSRFEEVSYENFCDNVGTHLGGYFLMSQQFALYFRDQGYGNIINMASIYGVIPPRFEVYEGTAMTMPVEYAAIKSAIIHLTKYMAKYFKGDKIRVNCISPGGILAGQSPSFLERYNEYSLSKGMLDPQDISGTLLYLLSDVSAFVNGQNIVVDDGWCL